MSVRSRRGGVFGCEVGAQCGRGEEGDGADGAAFDFFPTPGGEKKKDR